MAAASPPAPRATGLPRGPDPRPRGLAGAYGQDDDQTWYAAWADTAGRPYMISGSRSAQTVHARRSCGAINIEYGGALPGGPWPEPLRRPRPVFLTAAEAAAFLTASPRRHHCGVCVRRGGIP